MINPHKPCKWAIGIVRDEAEDILGWAQQAHYFAENVVCLVDPAGSDNTKALLEEHYPHMIIGDQDRTLGDSDNAKKGPRGVLIAHENQMAAVNHYVQEGEWFFLMAADERFDPRQWAAIADEIHQVKALNMAQGIFYTTMHHFHPNESECIDWYSQFRWGKLRYYRVWQKRGYFTKNGPIHSGYDTRNYQRFWWSLYPFYHYGWVKDTRKFGECWRDIKRFGDFPRYFFENPIPNWRQLN